MIPYDLLTSPVYNYAARGLTSRLLEGWTPRVFTTEQATDFTLPHSHRYELLSIVLAGAVTNRLWEPNSLGVPATWFATEIMYRGKPGQYSHLGRGPRTTWSYRSRGYAAGEFYFMTASDVHSIAFSAGACVLLLEGPSEAWSSVVLHNAPTFEVEPGLFTGEP